MRNGKEYTPQEMEEELENMRQEDEKKLPSSGKIISNFTKAVVKHALDGFNKVTPAEYTHRIMICNKCDMRVKNRCTHEDCGCFIEKKAWWNSEKCPLNKWDNK